MKLKMLIILTVSIFLGKKVHANIDTLLAAQLKPLGRSLINGSNKLELISSAVHFGYKFRGESCTIYASLKDEWEHNYIQYEIDGKYQKRIRINGNSKAPIVIKTDGIGQHTVWIYKATEAHTGPIIIDKIIAEKISAISARKAPLIEFIGNSITCGAASDPSEYPCGTGEYHDQHNAYMAYGPRVSRRLAVNYIMSSVSGIGIYRTWNREGPSMPEVYENIDFKKDTDLKWDFKKYAPKIVSIALGTNDLSTGDGKTPRKPFDADTFVTRYVDFIKFIKSRYPLTKIALLSSPMVKGAQRKLLEESLLRIKKRIDSMYPAEDEVSTFFFQEMEPHGCGGHPSVEDHLILAQQLYPFYRKLLNSRRTR
ncbi:lysophospholipase L1-like esterase [Pedobacter sp. W3I1]|uniref:SGNH/GDSL hydrolase family protein n=1 Tax=Pedobacter sp. W3I1 TaxID=3042291 RepID=UPI00278850FE|nr:SGNH/GDSL hydrolase family protein [Pedobacter sp. W3I1]MDQ0638439.1 lysophospholipase L1-like esterase [Pedobacter sp. W3I1]